MGADLSKKDADRMLAVEHEILNQLIDQLRGEIAVIPRVQLDPWIEKVRDRFEHFEAHLIRHMALEEHGGYLAPVMEYRPTLAPEVARLKHAHGEFMRLMQSIRLEIRELQGDDRLLPLDCRDRVGRLLTYIDQHEHEEDMLLIDALSRDIGVKD